MAELEKAEAGSDGDQELALDFTAVTGVSDSFADGFVGAVFSKRRSLGLPDPEIVEPTPFVRKVIDRTLHLRELDELQIAA